MRRRERRAFAGAVVLVGSLVAGRVEARVQEAAPAAPELPTDAAPAAPPESTAPAEVVTPEPTQPPTASPVDPSTPIQRPRSLAPPPVAPPPASPPEPPPVANEVTPPAPAPVAKAATPPPAAPVAEGPVAESVAKEPEAKKSEPVPGDSKSRREEVRRWRHAGFIVDLGAGFGGCVRTFCGSTAGHDAGVGARLGGFVGGNIFGILEVGLSAGWNTLRPRGVAGRNALELYGLDPVKVAEVIAMEMGVPALAVDLTTLTVSSATSRAFDLGPSLRVHFIRKGRGLAYVGADIHYQLWRNRYATAGGDMRLDFHGVSAPLRAGGGAYVHKNVAIVGEFNYVLATFVVGRIDHPMLNAAAPLRGLEGAASQVATGLTKGLPHFWNVTVNLRFRF